MPDVRIRFTPSEKKVLLKVVDENEVLSSFSIRAKKTLDGNVIIYGHEDIYIILKPEQKKIVTFKKESVNGDTAYGAADRMFNYLISRGVIDPGTIQGGSTLDSFEAAIPETDVQVPIKVFLLAISKWLEKEKPYTEYGQDYEDMMSGRVVEPDEEESTELGEVPQDKEKGSIIPGYYRSPYWMSYMLEQREK
jgi:hypothetical protein